MAIKYYVEDDIVRATGGDWPKTKKGALREAIRKWEWLVTYLDRAKHVPTTGRGSCALCVTIDCDECPVYAKTGRDSCKGTPYMDYYIAAERDNMESAKKAAKEEVKFLKSLLKNMLKDDPKDVLKNKKRN